VNHITGDVHYLALSLSKRKTVLTIHDLASLHRLHGLLRFAFRLLWYDLPIKRSAVVTVISHLTKQELLDCIRVPARKIRVIHDCVRDTLKCAPREFNEEKPVILQVGTGPNKNLPRVTEALKGIRCHLRVVGRLDDGLVSMLRAKGIEHSAVCNISEEAVTREYEQCDVVLFASTYEGFGLPIVEAQAVGWPVVTSNIWSMPEVAGGAACLTDPFDVSSIRNSVLAVIEDPAYRNELVNRGLDNVARFRADVVARAYCSIYQELADS
jgi:glycosyltransferase involved in cell wall biosynthesis